VDGFLVALFCFFFPSFDFPGGGSKGAFPWSMSHCRRTPSLQVYGSWRHFFPPSYPFSPPCWLIRMFTGPTVPSLVTLKICTLWFLFNHSPFVETAIFAHLWPCWMAFPPPLAITPFPHYPKDRPRTLLALFANPFIHCI